MAVFAMLADKDIASVIQALSQQIDVWYIAEIDHLRAASVDQIKSLFKQYLPEAKITTFKTITEAYHRACIDANENDRILALGSFFTVAEVMRASQDNIQQ